MIIVVDVVSTIDEPRHDADMICQRISRLKTNMIKWNARVEGIADRVVEIERCIDELISNVGSELSHREGELFSSVELDVCLLNKNGSVGSVGNHGSPLVAKVTSVTGVLNVGTE